MSKNIVLLSTHDFAGAGESLYRIAKAIQSLGHNTKLLVREKTKHDPLIVSVQNRVNTQPRFRRVFSRLRHLFGTTRSHSHLKTDPNFYFFNEDEGNTVFSDESFINALSFKPDIIILGWVTGFVTTANAAALQSHTGAKVYWLMTDMAPITGGCHYAWDCLGYTASCMNCPAILSEEYKDRAAKNLKLKQQNIQKAKIQVIAGSGWTHSQASQSSLFAKQYSIPIINGLIDLTVFNNSKRNIAKEIFDIDSDSIVILCGATYTAEKRKGIFYLVEALEKLHQCLDPKIATRIKILVAGNNLKENKFVRQIPFEIVPINFIKDERLLSLAYQAANIFICSSIEDSGPMMVNEALACGTPVVGFEMGLVSNMVLNGENGYKIPVGDTTAMAAALKKMVTLTPMQATSFSQKGIEMVKKHASLQSLKYVIDQITSK